MTIDNPLFGKFVTHVLSWEGTLSNDQDDTAASCAPFWGAYHTNKGVTYCTFKALAASLGISPVTYQTFIALTTQQVKKFIYHFYKTVDGDKFSDLIGLSLTEVAWGSGEHRAAIHLQNAVNELGGNLTVDGIIGPKTIEAANAVNQEKLYDQFWIDRKKFIEYLISLPKYYKWRNGWRNRIAAFLRSFPVTAVAGGIGILLLFILGYTFRKQLF